MIRDLRMTLGLGIAAFLLLGAASVAQAQYYQPPPPPGYYAPPPRYYAPPPPPPPRAYGYGYGNGYRSGLVIGAGLGFGGISADNCGDSCGGGLGYEFHIGGMLNPQLALLFDISGVAHPIPNTDVDAVNTMYNIALRFFPINILWLEGGVGLAHYSETGDYEGELGSDTGKAIMAAIGVDVFEQGPFAIDLQLRLGESFYDTAKDHGSLAFLVGFTWY